MKTTGIIPCICLCGLMLMKGQSQTGALPERRGFMFGAAGGGGLLLKKDKDVDLTSFGKMSLLNLKLGWMLNQQTAVCLHIPSGGHKDHGELRAFEAIMATYQRWLSDRFWGMAGLGLAMDMPPFYDTSEDDPKFYFGSAVCAGAGFEFWRRGKFALDIQARCLFGIVKVEGNRRQSTALDFLIGFNWY